MPEIPDYQTVMAPLLRIAAEGETTIPKAVERLAVEFSLTPAQLAEMLPSGKQQVINNRAHWAKTFLTKAGLLEQPRRGVFRTTPRGLQALKQSNGRIDNTILESFEEFRQFLNRGLSNQKGTGLAPPVKAQTLQESVVSKVTAPDERIDAAAKELEVALKDDLLQRIFMVEPQSSRARFFERLVIRLLTAMGYGGGREESAFHIGGRGDEGVDGVIHQDALGLDPVYVQAKCYDRAFTIGPEKIQAFKGALDDKGATRGVFITTARFTVPRFVPDVRAKSRSL